MLISVLPSRLWVTIPDFSKSSTASKSSSDLQRTNENAHTNKATWWLRSGGYICKLSRSRSARQPKKKTQRNRSQWNKPPTCSGWNSCKRCTAKLLSPWVWRMGGINHEWKDGIRWNARGWLHNMARQDSLVHRKPWPCYMLDLWHLLSNIVTESVGLRKFPGVHALKLQKPTCSSQCPQ